MVKGTRQGISINGRKLYNNDFVEELQIKDHNCEINLNGDKVLNKISAKWKALRQFALHKIFGQIKKSKSEITN